MQTGQRLREFGVKKVICVYDKGVKAAGIVDKIVNNVRAVGIEVFEFDQVLPDPPDYTVDQGAEIGRREQVDGVLGIGGGSAMDTAKGINLLLVKEPPITQYLNPGVDIGPGKTLVLIPTTAGTGSEVTNIGVISNTKTKLKAGFAGPAGTADLAIVDPTLMLGLPPQITAATGMDAFAHALEAYTSGQKNLMSDVWAEKAIQLVTEYLPRAVKNGSDIEARTQLAFAATTAGFAFGNSMIHMGHAIAHALGAYAHIPHGVGCALVLPEIVKYLSKSAPDNIRGIGRAMGMVLSDDLSPEEVGKVVSDRIKSLNKEVGIPSLKDYNIKADQLPAIVNLAMGEGCLMFMTRKAGMNDITIALDNMFEDK